MKIKISGKCARYCLPSIREAVMKLQSHIDMTQVGTDTREAEKLLRNLRKFEAQLARGESL